MKKTLFALILAIVTCSLVFAEDIIKVLNVYSDGACTTIPLAGIDSLDHSLYDSDSILHSDYTSSVIHAIDRDYNIPIASIDSIVFDEIDVAQYDAQINEISDFINQQTELELNAFQDNLLTWLNANGNIQKATINEAKDLITVKFKNGLDIHIDFQDMSFYEAAEAAEEEVEAYFSPRKAFSDENCYDVSSQPNEKIIESPNILYIQGHDFHKEFETNAFNNFLAEYFPKLYDLFYERDNSQEEHNKLKGLIASSPVNLKLKTIPYSLLFLDESFSNYGLILIAQTHGASDIKGAFMVDDISAVPETEYSIFYWRNMCINKRSFQIYTTYNNNNEKLIIKKENKQIFWIEPSLIARKLKDSNSIVFGSYCFSYGLAGHLKNHNTLLGYISESSYGKNTKYLSYYVNNMLLGRTHEQTMLQVKKHLGDYQFISQQSGAWTNVTLNTNYPNSQERFFSISTDDITEKDENGNPIITGQINGFNNLRNVLKSSSMNYRLYWDEGSEPFTPGVDYISVSTEGITIDSNGKITCKLLDTDELLPGFYSFIIGFEYEGNIFYGERKIFEMTGLCPDDNHPHMIDLGLPSGTKWCCCNVGANAPEEYGGYYAWGETSEKSQYGIRNYKYYNPNSDNGELKYYNIGSNIANTSYDVARVRMGGSWRMPSLTQQKELINNCSNQWTQQNGVGGILVKGPNGNQIFLPAAGFKNEEFYGEGAVGEAGVAGLYWSSSIYPSYDIDAYAMLFSGTIWLLQEGCRDQGLSVRAVCP